MSNTRTNVSCEGTLPVNTEWNTSNTYTSTWNVNNWSTKTANYNTTPSTNDCRYKCIDGYYRSGTSCVSKCFETTENNGKITITNYKKGAYSECGATVVIPAIINGKPVTAIGKNAFKQKNLTAITLLSSLRTIGNFAFYGNNIAGTLTLNQGLISIGSNAFAWNNLKSL